jgi:hypothetical protein
MKHWIKHPDEVKEHYISADNNTLWSFYTLYTNVNANTYTQIERWSNINVIMEPEQHSKIIQ